MSTAAADPGTIGSTGVSDATAGGAQLGAGRLDRTRPSNAPGCAAVARELGEGPSGTASPIRSWIMVEHPGAWGRHVREHVFAAALSLAEQAVLQRLWTSQGMRPLVIRRPGRQRLGNRRTVFVGGAATGYPPSGRWLERLDLGDLTDLSGLDLARVADGRGGLGEPVDGPMFAVCTHGAKDMCCATFGRPVASALAERFGDRVWEVTHVGGDRFAGNLLVLPDGLLHGQLDPASAVAIAEAALDGWVLPDQLRGRTAATPVEQAAEVAVRRRTGLTGLDDVVPVPGSTVADGRTATVSVATAAEGGLRVTHRVRLSRQPLGTCGTTRCAGLLRPVPLAVDEIALT